MKTIAPLCFVYSLMVASASAGDTVFTNLTNDRVFLARMAYSDGSSSQPVGDYSLPVESPAGWRIHGWFRLDPGSSLRLRPGNYYVEKNRRQVTWSKLDWSSGLIPKNRRAFDDFLRAGSQNQDVNKLKNRGFVPVRFQKFRAQRYTISGDAYRIVNKTFNFNQQSRSAHPFHKWFKVPGKVVTYRIQSDERYASNIKWYVKNGREVVLSGVVEGKQHRPFGPREPGFYRGKVKVLYTLRRT